MVKAYVDAQENAKLAYFGPGVNEIGTACGKAIEAIVFGQKTPEQAAKDAQQESQAVLDRVLKEKAG